MVQKSTECMTHIDSIQNSVQNMQDSEQQAAEIKRKLHQAVGLDGSLLPFNTIQTYRDIDSYDMRFSQPVLTVGVVYDYILRALSVHGPFVCFCLFFQLNASVFYIRSQFRIENYVTYCLESLTFFSNGNNLMYMGICRSVYYMEAA